MMEIVDFTEIRKKSDRSDIVKMRLSNYYKPVKKNTPKWYCTIFIGSTIMQSLGWKQDDVITLMRQASFPLSIYLKKNNELRGHKLKKIKNSNSFSVAFTWDQPEIVQDGKTFLTTVEHEIINDYIKINYG
jgi:hypothetical protein